MFDRVHLITLVFGASLVGVAEDFGIHYFASRSAAPHETGGALMQRLAPGMALALGTSVLAYAVMALVPFPACGRWRCFLPSAWWPPSSPWPAGSRRWRERVAA